jgi:hypothetical protein
MHTFTLRRLCWLIDAHLPNYQVGGIHITENVFVLLLVDEILQLVDVVTGWSVDLERCRLALDEAPKRENCDLRHGGGLMLW